MRKLITAGPFPLLITLFVVTAVQAQDPRRDQPAPETTGGRQGHRQEMEMIHALFAAHSRITRQVTVLEDGVVTLTESADPTIREMIVAHARAMKLRLEKRQPIRAWDPLFAALFENADKIRMELIPTARGVRVIETSTDPDVISLIKAHAAGVSEFVRDGAAVMHKPHPLPVRK